MIYKWIKVRNGITLVGMVDLDIQKNESGENIIIENYSGDGFTSQGDIESVLEIGYDSWKMGAKNGLEYGFSLVEGHWTVIIKKIEGLSTDTNPTIIGYTALLAFLNGCEYKINSMETECLEKFVVESCKSTDKEEIPNFFELKFEN